MPAADTNAPFFVTAVTYAALRRTTLFRQAHLYLRNKAFGYLKEGIGAIYDPASLSLDTSNQFSPAGSAAGLRVMPTDAPRCPAQPQAPNICSPRGNSSQSALNRPEAQLLQKGGSIL